MCRRYRSVQDTEIVEGRIILRKVIVLGRTMSLFYYECILSKAVRLKHQFCKGNEEFVEETEYT